ncbi:hypothetical protein ABJZ48_14380, partial [Enterococcus faecalis]
IVIPPAIFFYYSTLFDSRFKTLQQNPNYYSGKTDAKTRQAVLKKFVKKETLSDFLSEKSRARSMFPWEVKKKDKQWTIAFIVVLINEKDEQSTKKITFTAEETKEQLVVMERPTEEDFELTN